MFYLIKCFPGLASGKKSGMPQCKFIPVSCRGDFFIFGIRGKGRWHALTIVIYFFSSFTLSSLHILFFSYSHNIDGVP
jgi:hypothetical protein